MKSKRIRVAAEIDRAVIAKMDAERKGMYSRAAIIRMALEVRYLSHHPKLVEGIDLTRYKSK